MHPLDKISIQIAELNRQKRAMKEDLLINKPANMTKKELMDYAMTLPQIPDHLFDAMKDYGFPTGSAVFGNIDNPSDVDYVCGLPASAFTSCNCAVSCGNVSQDYIDQNLLNFVPLYGNRDGQLYNIICIGDGHTYRAWNKATNVMQELAARKDFTHVVQEKWKRVRLFRALCDVFEDPLPLYKEIDLDEALKYSKCTRCGREAINFMDKTHKDFYKTTGLCERCQEQVT